MFIRVDVLTDFLVSDTKLPPKKESGSPLKKTEIPRFSGYSVAI
jgi:hypothetical protein